VAYLTGRRPTMSPLRWQLGDFCFLKHHNLCVSLQKASASGGLGPATPRPTVAQILNTPLPLGWALRAVTLLTMSAVGTTLAQHRAIELCAQADQQRTTRPIVSWTERRRYIKLMYNEDAGNLHVGSGSLFRRASIH